MSPEAQPRPQTPRRSPGSAAFSLVEILVATTLAAVVVLFLAQILNTTTAAWSGVQRSSDAFAEARSALGFLQRDLSGAFGSRPANLPKIKETLTEEQETFFEGRLFLPFEVNRIHGLTGELSFENGEEPRDGFGQLAYALACPLSRHVNSIGGGLPSGGLFAESDLGLGGYYVAFTRDSPIAGSRSSMKLHRHLRPAGGSNARGVPYARNLILHLNQTINQRDDEAPPRNGVLGTALVRQGVFANASLPYLFSSLVIDEVELNSTPAQQPWPRLPPLSNTGTTTLLPAPPPTYPPPERGDIAAWTSPAHPAQSYLFPDDAVARNVVRFEVTPYRWIEAGTPQNPEPRPLGAAELSAHLGIPGEEWPVLVTPDFIDVTLSVINDEAAAKLTSREDWIFDWSANPGLNGDWRRQLVEKNLRTFRSRIHIRSTH